MWFKNLRIYRFKQPFELDAATLGEQLGERVFTPCGGQEESRSGWVSPLGRQGSELVHVTNGYLMICLKRQDKLLPAGVINEELEEKASEIEAREGRQMPRKERRSLRDEVMMSMLPRAFVRSRLLYAYISLRDNLLIVDSAAAGRAEELLQQLRDTLGSLPVVPLASRQSPIELMTRWVESANPAPGFELGETCELRDSEDAGSVIRCKNQDLGAAEIVNHVKSGMHVSQLAVSWNERVECQLDGDFVVKRLRFADIVLEQAGDSAADDAAARFDADFAIMSLEVSAFTDALLAAFGGLEPAAESQAASQPD